MRTIDPIVGAYAASAVIKPLLDSGFMSPIHGCGCRELAPVSKYGSYIGRCF